MKGLVSKGVGRFFSLGTIDSITEDKARLKLFTPYPVCLSDDATPGLAITELVFASKNGIVLSEELSRKVRYALGIIDQEAKNHSTKVALDGFLNKRNEILLGKDFFFVLSGTKTQSLRKEKKEEGEPLTRSQIRELALRY